jgi:hypothetical protein
MLGMLIDAYQHLLSVIIVYVVSIRCVCVYFLYRHPGKRVVTIIVSYKTCHQICLPQRGI